MDLSGLMMTDAQIDSILGAGSAAKAHLKTLHLVTREGRAARAIGLTLHDCPPFVDDDMATSWRIGWYDEDLRRDPKGFAIREQEYIETGIMAHERPRPESRANDYRRRRTCPKCGASPGLTCRGPTGKPIADEHVARWKNER
jgi:hypothetical protein